MFRKIYPPDQIQNYLLIDLWVMILFLYNVLFKSETDSVLLKLFLAGLFLVAYFFGLWLRDLRVLIPVIVGFSVIAFAAHLINYPILLFGIIFCDFLGRAERKIYIPVGIASIFIIFLLFISFKGGIVFIRAHPFLLPIMILELIYPVAIHIREKTKKLEEELAKANELVEKLIQEEERNRIARDLHDTLGQTLTMIKLKSELAERFIEVQPERAKKELHDIVRTSRLAIQQVREAVYGMTYVPLKEEIQDAKELLSSAAITGSVEYSDAVPDLSAKVETMIALSIREAITNVIRHSRAKTCLIRLDYHEGLLKVTIQDDGIGFSENVKVGTGIQSIKERIQNIQGHVLIESEKEKGTRVYMEIPLSKEGEEPV